MHRCAVLGLLGVLLGAAGCSSIGRSLGRGAADGGVQYLKEPTTRVAVRTASDSLLLELAASFRANLRPMLDSTVEAALAKGDQALGRAQDSLSATIEGSLSTSLQRLVQGNIEAAGSASRAELHRTVEGLSEDLERDLLPVLRRSVTEATRALMVELSEGVRTKLAAAATEAVAGAVDAGVKAGSKQVEKSPPFRTALWVAVGVGASIVFLGVAWLIRERRRTLAALDVVAGEIKRRGDDTLRSEIKSQAEAKGVEGWFHAYLARRGHL